MKVGNITEPPWVFDARPTDSTDALFAWVGTDNRIKVKDTFFTCTFMDKAWHHYAFTTDGTTYLTFFYDGVSKGNIVHNTLVYKISKLVFGANNLGAGPYFKGGLDEISVWNTAHTAAQVTEMWNSGVPGNLASHSLSTNLQAWWRFSGNYDDSSGKTPARNLSQTNNPGFSTDVKTV